MLSTRPLSLNTDGPATYGATKTPGRIKARKENSVHPGTRTANVKAYKATLRTPAPDGGLKPHKLFADAKPAAGARPLGDKTPFPNRARRADEHGTPAPLGKLALGDARLGVPEPQLRPSSTRKSIRGRRSGGPAFETPVTSGRHWDVSDVEIAVPVAEDVGVGVETETETEDYDEPEYGPPGAIERPYEPPFEMPDYREAGKRLFEMMHGCWYDDREEVYYARDRETMDQGVLEATGFQASPTKWEALPLPELEDDDPFAAYRPTPQPSTKQSTKAPLAGPKPKPRAPSRAAAPPSMKPVARAPLARAPSARTTPSTTAPSTRTTRSASVATTARTTLSTAVAPTPAPSRPPTVTARRPATSASVRPPVRPARPGVSAGPPPASGLRKATKAVPAPAVDDLVLVFEGQDGAGDVDFKFDV